MNNHKRNFFILGTIFGVFLCVIAGVFYLNMPLRNGSSPEKLSFNTAVELIQDGKFKEAEFSDSQVIFVDENGNNYLVTVAGDANREILLKEIQQTNTESAKPMTVSERPQTDIKFFGFLYLINFLPFLIIGFCLVFSLHRYFNSKQNDKDLE